MVAAVMLPVPTQPEHRAGAAVTHVGAALDELEKNQFLPSSMGGLLSRCYLAVRRSEDEAFSARDKDSGIRSHFYRC
jgi:glutamine synthetase